MGIKWIKWDEMGLFWECNWMQFNKMAKLKRLKGFSEFVKKVETSPKKRLEKNPTRKNRLDWNSKKWAKNYQNE